MAHKSLCVCLSVRQLRSIAQTEEFSEASYSKAKYFPHREIASNPRVAWVLRDVHQTKPAAKIPIGWHVSDPVVGLLLKAE